MLNDEIRWHQRLDSYDKALSQLNSAVELSEERPLSKLEQQGLIQAFEFTYELSWNLIKDYYNEQGDVDIQGSRDAFRLAFKRGLIIDGDLWMNMIKSRMMTSHTYNEETANDITDKIITQYSGEFVKLSDQLNRLKINDEQ